MRSHVRYCLTAFSLMLLGAGGIGLAEGRKAEADARPGRWSLIPWRGGDPPLPKPQFTLTDQRSGLVTRLTAAREGNLDGTLTPRRRARQAEPSALPLQTQGGGAGGLFYVLILNGMMPR